MYLSRPSSHHPVTVSPEHHQMIEKKPSIDKGPHETTKALAPAPPPESFEIPLTTVSLNSNFDAYIDIWFKGAPDSPVQLLLDSGNSMLIVPRWEDIEALPNAKLDYHVLGATSEPWGCPANVVRGPIDLVTTSGDTCTLQDCVFYACTGNPPSGGDRTANFGAGCLSPGRPANGTHPPPFMSQCRPRCHTTRSIPM